MADAGACAPSGSAPGPVGGPHFDAQDAGAERRFGGVARLYGEAGANRIAASHAVVIGLGGVGSWAAEALARCGIGRLTLVDLDHVAESNVNRQVHALGSTLGAAKVDAMAARIADISPATVVLRVDDFVTADNAGALVDEAAQVVVDAIDAPRAKAALIALCGTRGQPLVVCGAAGGRADPLSLRRTDLAEARGDALLASVRARLRRDHGFPRGAGVPFGVGAIWAPAPSGPVHGPQPAAGAPLACAGYGSVVMMTAAMGFAAAHDAVAALLRAPATGRARRTRAGSAPAPGVRRDAPEA